MYDHKLGSDLSPAMPPQEIAEEDVIDIRALVMVLWRRKWVIINLTVFIAVLALVIVVQLTPRYTAQAVLAIEARQNSVVDLEAVMSGVGSDDAAIKTEIDVLNSRRLIGKLVDELRLVQDPEFNATLRQDKSFVSYLNPFIYIPSAWKDVISGGKKEQLTEAEKQQIARGKVIDTIKRNLSVSNPARSYTILLSFESEDAKKAAKIANALSNLYLTDQLEVKFEATQRANEWLNERVFQLREKVRETEQAAQQFREENQLIRTRTAGLVNEQQLAQINTQLVDARTDLAKAEARVQQVEQNATDGKLAESGLIEVLQSNLISRLKEQEAEVLRKRAELASRYGPKHPKMKNVEAEYNDIQAKIEAEISKIVAGIRAEADVARIRVHALENNLADLKKESFSVSRAQVEMRELDREAEANRLLLETFLNRFKETSSQDGMQQADARIISAADMPTEASFPKKGLMMALAIFLGAGLGIAMAFLLEALDNGYRTFDQIKHDIGLRALGMIPMVNRSVLKEDRPEDYLLAKPTSAYSEAHRNIHASLMFANADGTISKVLAVTSSVPGEGKSTAAICLAHTLGRSGLKILLVEADMRRPVLRKRMGIDDTFINLNSVLGADNANVKEKLFKDPVSGIDVITADRDDDPQRLFNSHAFETFIQGARKEYDLVIIDTPPVLAVSDVMVISRYVDSTMFIVQWEKTSKGTVKNAVKQLSQTGCHVSGVVLTRVDIKRHKGYGYGDQGYYYGAKNSYYTN